MFFNHTNPIVIELHQNGSSLSPWIPFLGSGLVALAAFLGVIVSNQKNRMAIAAADDREWIKWKRERLFEMSNSVIETVEYCASHFTGYHLWNGTESVRNFVDISNRFASVSNSARKIEMLVPDDPFKQSFREIMTTFAACAEAAKDNGDAARTAARRGTYDRTSDPMTLRAKALIEAGRGFAAESRTILKAGVQ